MCLIISALVLQLLFMSGFLADLRIKHTNQLSAPLTSFLFYGGKFYVGGVNKIYVLNEGLDIIQTTNTCDVTYDVCKNSRNINKILVARESKNGGELIVCGTGNFGICEVRNLSNIEIILGKSSDFVTADNYLKVSSNEHRPAVGMITQNGNLTIAVTFGEGIEGIEQYFTKNSSTMTYRYPISTRKLYRFEPVYESHSAKVLRLKISKVQIEDYLIYYKTCFQHNWVSYFITNQKSEVSSHNYVSKLVRICQNDTGYYSYADIVLVCKYNGKHYNLIQDSTLVDSENYSNNSGKIFIGAFARGNDPEHPSGDSVICVTELNTLDNAILEARREYTASVCKSPQNKNKYLPVYKHETCIKSKQDFDLFNFDCNIHTAYRNFIANTPVIMETRFHLAAAYGFITTLRATIYGGKLVVLLGTSTGSIVQTQMLQNYSLLEYSKETVDIGQEIRKIYVKSDETVYVMSSKRVMKYAITNCSEFRSCVDILQRRNPLCGWCVYKQRGTRRSECFMDPHHWVSPFGECLSMSVQPLSFPVSITSQSSSLNVTTRIVNIPMKHIGDIYYCRFSTRSYRNITTAVELGKNRFSCQISVASVHAYFDFGLLVRTKSGVTVVLSTTTLLLYDCRHYKRCFECTNNERAKCNWCTRTATCQEPKSVCVGPISEKDNCPQLLANRANFVPVGIRTTVTLRLINAIDIPEVSYRCLLPDILISIVASLSSNIVSCPLQVMKIGNQTKTDFKIVVTYGPRRNHFAEVDDIFHNLVTVYSCSQLASDCSHCQALSKARYSCIWCGTNQCVHSGTRCRPQCPAPHITKIIPSNGPTQGGTRVTIYGTNLGKSVSVVEAITVAGLLCDLIEDKDVHQIHHGPDFETPVPSRLVCITRTTPEELTGAVQVVVDGQSSEPDIEFSYKIPNVTDMHPKFGPKTGGTTITIYGNNLGIGHKNISILLGSQPCRQLKLYSKETSDVSNYTVLCTVECIIPGSCATNITDLSLSIDGQEVFRSNKRWFNFVNDPVASRISPKKAFISGGTTLTIEGKHLNNTQSSFIKLSYKEEIVIAKCDIVSAELTLCESPEAPLTLASMVLLEGKKNSTCDTSIDVTLALNFDAVRHNVTIAYFRDPLIYDLSGDNNVITFDSREPWLKITGNCLNTVAADSDISIAVGTKRCTIINVTKASIVCIPPTTRPPSVISGISHPQVNVAIGNIQKIVGYLRYEDQEADYKVTTVVYVLSGTVFLLIVVTGTFFLCCRYRKMKDRVTYLERRPEFQLRKTTNESRQSAAGAGNSTDRQSGIYAEINDTDLDLTDDQEGCCKYDKGDGYLVPHPYVEMYEGNVSNDDISTGNTSAVSKLSVRNSLNPDPNYIHPVYDLTKREDTPEKTGLFTADVEVENTKHPREENDNRMGEESKKQITNFNTEKVITHS